MCVTTRACFVSLLLICRLLPLSPSSGLSFYWFDDEQKALIEASKVAYEKALADAGKGRVRWPASGCDSTVPALPRPLH